MCCASEVQEKREGIWLAPHLWASSKVEAVVELFFHINIKGGCEAAHTPLHCMEVLLPCLSQGKTG